MNVPFVSREELVLALEETGLAAEPLVGKALAKVERYHGPQTRLGGGPMLEEHIYPVTLEVIRDFSELPWELYVIAVVTTILHDIREDCGIPHAEILEEFGAPIAILVDRLTDTGKTQAEYFRDIQGHCLLAKIKIRDRGNNGRCAHKISDRATLIEFCDNTEQFVMPLVRRYEPTLVDEFTATFARLRQLAA